MKLNVYSLFDTKALNYNQPFFAHTDGAAVRIVSDVANDTNTSIGRHPADYVLYRIGTYDDALGLLMPEAPLSHVIDCVALITIKPTGDLFGAPANPDTKHTNGRA